MTMSRTLQGTDGKRSSVVLMTLAASLIYGVSSGVNYASVSFKIQTDQRRQTPFVQEGPAPQGE